MAQDVPMVIRQMTGNRVQTTELSRDLEARGGCEGGQGRRSKKMDVTCAGHTPAPRDE